MNTAIILAGGVGNRVGAGIPKQFIEVLGKPVLVYTLEAFQEHPEIDSIEVVCVENYISQLKVLIEKYQLTKVKWIVKGGKEFQDSVMNGVNYLQDKVQDEDIILVHYGASPFVSAEIISDGIRVAKLKENCVSATPCFLLLGTNDDDKSETWVNRDKIMQLNSPQCFTYKYVKELYAEAVENNLLEKVEPHTTSLMYLMNRTIYFSKGDQSNIKITTKEDVDMFLGYTLMKAYKKE